MTKQYREYAVLINSRPLYYREVATRTVYNPGRGNLTTTLENDHNTQIAEGHLVKLAEEVLSSLRNQQGFIGMSVNIDALEPDHERIVAIDIRPDGDIEIVVTPWDRFVEDFMAERSKCHSETN